MRNERIPSVNIDAIKNRRIGFYEKYFKRLIDILLSLMGILCFSWLYIILAGLVRIKLGSPILFKQPRPGKNEHIFNMYKFRTMNNDTDVEGNLLPDKIRLTSFGKWLRSTSLDELPELFNVLKGDMSLIGPRPQLVRDMVFMSEHQRFRHSVTPGLSGLAQVNGRNSITWEKKFDWDLTYIQNISFVGDLEIILRTILKVLQKDDINRTGTVSDLDYGDVLLEEKKISRKEYENKLNLAKNILEKHKAGELK